MKTNNIEHKKRLLEERYNQGNHEISYNDWLQNELDNDPGMGRWLTDDENLADYELPDDTDELFDKDELLNDIKKLIDDIDDLLDQ